MSSIQGPEYEKLSYHLEQDREIKKNKIPLITIQEYLEILIRINEINRKVFHKLATKEELEEYQFLNQKIIQFTHTFSNDETKILKSYLNWNWGVEEAEKCVKHEKQHAEIAEKYNLDYDFKTVLHTEGIWVNCIMIFPYEGYSQERKFEILMEFFSNVDEMSPYDKEQYEIFKDTLDGLRNP
jgi:hypothetical protein